MINNNDESEDVVIKAKEKKAKIAKVSARQELPITSGASIVIKNILPFLKLEYNYSLSWCSTLLSSSIPMILTKSAEDQQSN